MSPFSTRPMAHGAYTFLFVYFTFRELQEQNDELRIKNEALENEVATLQKDVDDLQNEVGELQLLVEDLRSKVNGNTIFLMYTNACTIWFSFFLNYQ